MSVLLFENLKHRAHGVTVCPPCGVLIHVRRACITQLAATLLLCIALDNRASLQRASSTRARTSSSDDMDWIAHSSINVKRQTL